jgi:hypothetical protein
MAPRLLLSRSLSVLAAPLLLLAACAHEAPKPVKVENTREETAAVIAIDQATRMVTLRGPDGEHFTVYCSPEVRNFSQIKVLDNVVVRYYEAVGAELKSRGGTGTGATAAETAVEVGRAEEGQRPAGTVSTKTSAVVKIQDVDTKTNVVSFYGEDGELRAFPVQTPQGKEFIKKLKPGDEVEVTYTEALAISVEPAK